MTPKIESMVASSENPNTEKNHHKLISEFPQAFKENGAIDVSNLYEAGDTGTTFSTERHWPKGALVLDINIDPRDPSWGLLSRTELTERGNSLLIETNEGRNKTDFSVIKNGNQYMVCIKNLIDGRENIYPLQKRGPLGYSFGVSDQKMEFYEDDIAYIEAKSNIEESIGYSLEDFIIEFDSDFSVSSEDGVVSNGELRVIMDLE